MPITSVLGLPRPFDHRARKPGAPVPAMSSAPEIIASLMTLPPSSVSQLTLTSPRPALAAWDSRNFFSCITKSGR